ncbi:MEDS domain-containing protein [Allorhizocola rhizosphaerae]|uniref:MEDS domain-containing protein n=1 Tax=Allorhizocola rhizosphaerae TaxID=1872709 RepID=UPI0014794C9F|nr:MEDS domain-containing protein [Allorhizocola rhizosphaerae]
MAAHTPTGWAGSSPRCCWPRLARTRARRAHIVGEPIWAGRSPTEYPACAQPEALVNDAFAGRDAILLCPYDESALEPAVLADALYTHPTLTDADRTWTSPGYEEQAWRRFNPPLADPPAHARHLDVLTHTDLAAVRRAASAFSPSAAHRTTSRPAWCSPSARSRPTACSKAATVAGSASGEPSTPSWRRW